MGSVPPSATATPALAGVRLSTLASVVMAATSGPGRRPMVTGGTRVLAHTPTAATARDTSTGMAVTLSTRARPSAIPWEEGARVSPCPPASVRLACRVAMATNVRLAIDPGHFTYPLHDHGSSDFKTYTPIKKLTGKKKISGKKKKKKKKKKKS